MTNVEGQEVWVPKEERTFCDKLLRQPSDCFHSTVKYVAKRMVFATINVRYADLAAILHQFLNGSFLATQRGAALRGFLLYSLLTMAL
jgi:hypothetical protein